VDVEGESVVPELRDKIPPAREASVEEEFQVGAVTFVQG
jgi:hypothetical protein